MTWECFYWRRQIPCLEVTLFDHGYKATLHAVNQIKERTGSQFSPAEVEELCKEGEVVIDTQTHRYIRNGDFFFPCAKEPDAYHIKTTMLWDMVKHRLQRVIDLYNKI